MSFSQHFVRLCIAFLIVVFGLRQANGQGWYRKSGSKILPYYTITVAQSGRANFSTIQSAIDSIPSNNKYWVCIRIKAGIYREKVKIPYDKPYILLKGEARRSTVIVWDEHESIAQSPTFTSLADNIVAKSLSFKNSYNVPVRNNPREPAPAAMISGDRSRFIRCGFYGLQDTLWDDQGRHYYQNCIIQGAVDFIFGTGQSIFENCSISVIGDDLEPGFIGYITAQGRTNPNDANGFVFNNCQVYGTGQVYLGRPWRSYARVLFFNTKFTNVIVPQGWDAWYFTRHVNQLTLGEEACYGEGSDKSQRVKWEAKLSSEAIREMISRSFIDEDGWIVKQPY